MRSSRIIAGCVVATSAILSCFNTVEAQSFRHGGAEFNAVRSVVASNEKGYSVVVTEFLAHGELRPDGRNLWVAARNREAVPFRVLQIGPGDFCRAAFQTVEGQSIYDVFYGGEPLQGDPPAWTSRDGLLLETRKFRQCNLRSLDSVRAAFEAAEPIGADFVDGVFHADNPFGQIGQPFLSRYSGYLHVKEPGVFGFYVSSRDCGFLLIDGKEAAAAPGRHGPQRQARPGLRRDVRLAAGEHKFEYYHAAAGAGAVMSAAWEVNPPGEKPGRPQKIPADAFNAPFIGRLPAGRVNMRVGGQSPDFLAETTGDVPLPDNNIPLIGVKFSNVSPQTLTAPGARMQWDFGDGQTSDFPNVDHVYLRPGLYTATLSIRRGARKAEITNRIYVDRPRTAPRDKPHVLDEYLRIIETYDPARLDAEALLQLALAFEAKALAQPDEADAYLNKAVRAVRAALQDCSAAEGDGLLNVARLAGPMTRFRLGDSAAAYQIWLGAAGKCGAPEAKAACEIAAADVAVNDLLRPADAKKLLESAAINLADDRAGTIAADLHRVWGDCRAAAGDGPAARKSYLEAERLIGRPRQFNLETAQRGAHARSTEDFLTSKQYVRAAEELDMWLRRFPAARLDGYLTLLYARYWAGCERHSQAVGQADQLRAVAPDSPYTDQLLILAADCEMRLGRKDRAIATLHALVNDYPGSPLAPLARKNIEILEAEK